MQAGLDVFSMDSPEHKELKEVERDLNLMEQVRVAVHRYARCRQCARYMMPRIALRAGLSPRYHAG